MIKQDILNTLHQMLPALSNLKDNYYIIGGSALILQGLPLKRTHDIDLLCTTRDLAYLKDKWTTYYISSMPSPIEERFQSTFAGFKFPLMEVELQANLTVLHKGKWMDVTVEETTSVSVDGVEIKVPTLIDMIRILTLFGRDKDIRRIGEIKDYMSLS